MSNISFIHTGDLHLGSPLKTAGEISGALRKSLIESNYIAIKNIVDAALEFNVDFVLICGDIYDIETRSVKGNRYLARQLKRLADIDTPVYIIYGNHDPIGKGKDFFELPDNVRILGIDTVESVEISDKNGGTLARVLGQCYNTPSESRRIHLNYNPPTDDLINIAMLHTGLDSSSNRYVPCSVEELKTQSNIHYWALGHIHSARIINTVNPVIAYPGIPQGRDVGETGLKGCFLVEADNPKKISIQFIPTSPIIWMLQNISIDTHPNLKNLDDLMEILIGRAEKIINTPPSISANIPIIDNGYRPEGYVIRWIIEGRSPIHDELISGRELEIEEELRDVLNHRLAPEKPFLWTERIKLRTGSPIPDLECLIDRDETIGMLNDIREKIQNNTDFREKAISIMGNIWYKSRGSEDLRDDSFPITAQKFDSLLKDAFNIAVERIVKEREKD